MLTVYRLLECHPCIAPAAVALSKIIIPKADKDSSIDTPVPRRSNQYAMDAMFDDEDDDDEQAGAQRHTVCHAHSIVCSTYI